MDARFLVLLVALALGGCDCGDARMRQGGGELATEETQIDFGQACPSAAVAGLDVEPVVRTLHLTNQGNSLLYLNRLEVEPSMAAVFVVDRSRVPETIAAGEVVEVPIRFEPAQAGTAVADLTLVGDDAEPLVVKLLGEGLALPPQPQLALSCPGGKWNNDGCALASPGYFFTDTPAGSVGEAAISLSNRGCGALSVSSLQVSDGTAGPEVLPVFSLAEGQAKQLRIPGGQSAEVQVRFAPQTQGAFSGALSGSTNAPASPQLRLPLRGLGVAAVLGLDPGLCDFRSPDSPCAGRFSIANAGGQDLIVQAVRLQAGNSMFRIARSPEPGSRIAPNRRLEGAIEIEYLPGPRLGSDLLVVESSGGSATAELRGGAPPVLRTDPEGLLDFGVQLSEGQDYFLPVRLLNAATWARQAPLTLYAVELDSRPPSNARGAFSLIGSGEADCPEPPAPGTLLQPGAQSTVCVRFHAAPGGGSFFANLLVRSDDPDFPGPDGLLLPVSASTTCDPAPVAQVSVAAPGTCPCADGYDCVDGGCHLFGSAQASLGGRTLLLSGVTSHDLVPDALGACVVRDPAGIRFWEWSLRGSPEGSQPTLVPEGKGEVSQTTLGFDVAGTYLVGLVVHDLSGRASEVSTFTVVVSP